VRITIPSPTVLVDAHEMSRMSRDRELGLRLIVGYKFGKAALEVMLGLALLFSARRASDDVRHFAPLAPTRTLRQTR